MDFSAEAAHLTAAILTRPVEHSRDIPTKIKRAFSNGIEVSFLECMKIKINLVHH